ncbi:hypothetical protein AMK59_7185 [Oryctes borbonicus]|uniref:Uncharacterized protein n=1 Tax=Oryctes borbonicus TaxID=1629725 RepID=A0A0T6AWY8_9SCAR|nr:hypothetical protein AMK59_7185 [Oryctes borbonicus]
MDNFIVIRQSKTTDIPAINQVVRDAYLSNIFPAWINALTKEITFQLIVISAAIMFIFMGVPFQYCVLAVPAVMLLLLVVVASAFLMKAAELAYTFQLIVISAAIMFIFMGVPFQYCVLAVPAVMLLLLVVVASAFLMKAAELAYGKRSIQCWVAEAYEPYFSMQKPESQQYQIISEYKVIEDSLDLTKCRKQIIGTISVARFINSQNGAWLFRLAVSKR